MYKDWLARDLMNEWRNQVGESFSVDNEVTRVCHELAEFLTGGDGDKFGCLLCGTCGNGKTSLLKAFQSRLNFYREWHFLADRRQTDGSFVYGMAIVKARDWVKLESENSYKFTDFREHAMLAIDDLGDEPAELVLYGNLLRPISDLLDFRYTNTLFTMATTNLRPSEIRAKYGDRIADRMNEMMRVITFHNPSYRK